MAEGYTCKEMRSAGFSLAALKRGYTDADLKVTHFTTKAELANDGYPLRDLRLAGYTVAELVQSGCSAKALMAIGFSKAQIKSAGGG